MADLKTYMDKLGAGAPRVGAWFREDYTVEVKYGATYGAPARVHDGMRVKPKNATRLAFHAPFSGWAQLVSPRQGSVPYSAGSEFWAEMVTDPTLQGVRRLDGAPFQPRLDNKRGFTLLYTCFPSAYLRLKWLFVKHLGAGRSVPHRFAVTVEKRDEFSGTHGVQAINGTLQGQGIFGASGGITSLMQTLGWFKSMPTLKAHTVDLKWDQGDELDPSPQYYTPVGAQLLAAASLDVVVFDEFGWPMDPIYAWNALYKVAATDNANLQAGYSKGSAGDGSDDDNPLKKHHPGEKAGGKGVTIHTVSLHGAAAAPYLRRALKMDTGSSHKLESATAGKEPVVRRATPESTSTSSTTTEKKLKLKLDIPSGSKSKGALGLAPGGTLAEKTLEHSAWDYDYLRLVLVDQTRHVARNRPASTSGTASEAFPSTSTPRAHKAETVVTPHHDGAAILGAIDGLLETAAKADERRLAWVAPRIDPFLDLQGYRGSGIPLEKKAATDAEKWTEAQVTDLASLGSRLVVRAASASGGSAKVVQLLIVPQKTLPQGAYLRIYPQQLDLATAQARRGSGAAASASAAATSTGACVLPLPALHANLWFDALVAARSGDEGKLTPHLRAGFQLKDLPGTPKQSSFDFRRIYLGYDAASGKATLTFDPSCANAPRYVVVVNPRTGWLYDSDAESKQVGGGQTLTVDLYREENSIVQPHVTAGDMLFVGVKPKKGATLEACEWWHGLAFPASMRAGALVPTAPSSVMARLTATGKGDKAKQFVMARDETQVQPDADRLQEQIGNEALESRLGVQFTVDGRVHGMAERRGSALYVHSKPASGSSEKESERAILSSAPVTGLHGDVQQRDLGDPQAEPGRTQATVGLSVQGRGSHDLYEAIKQWATAHAGDDWKGVFGANDSHAEVAPAEQTVKDSSHRVAVLRTAAKGLAGNQNAGIDALSALADAIRQATTSLYLEGPFLELYDRKPRTSNALAYKEGELHLLQLLHEQMRVQPNLRVIACIPREIRHPWGAVVEAEWYAMRKQAVRTLRYDGYEDAFRDAHTRLPPPSQFPPQYRAATLVHDRAVVFHPLTPQGTPVDVATNVVIVDDAWALVGDAGLRRRSLTFDPGINLALTDLALHEGAPKLVRALRVALLTRALGLRAEEAPRLTHFSSAFETVRGLCQRRLAHTVAGYDETWSHLPQAQARVAYRDALDPDGRHVGETALMGLVANLFKVIDAGAKEWRELDLRWQAPSSLHSKAATYEVWVREGGQPSANRLSQSITAPAGGAISHKLRYLEKTDYELYVACAADGKHYRAPKAGWKQAGATVSSLDLGVMAQVRQVRVAWTLPAAAPAYVMNYTLSCQQTSPSGPESQVNVALVSDAQRTCRHTLTLPDPNAQYSVRVRGEVETRGYASAGWKAVGTGAEVNLGELQAS